MQARVPVLSERIEHRTRPAGVFQQRVAPGVVVNLEADRIVDRSDAGARETLVFDNAHFGRVMMVDGVLRSSSADEFVYHEMMSHVPLLAHGRVERVLILGGTDSGLAEEVLKHRYVRKVVQVDSDHQTLEMAREHLSGINAPVFEDARFELSPVDSAQYLQTTHEQFDVVLTDLPEAVGMQASPLTREFFRSARGCLAAGGLFIARVCSPFLQPAAFSVVIKRLSAVYPVVASYLVPVPSVIGGPVAIGWASNVLRPDEPSTDVLASRLSNAFINTHYYTPEVHRAAFALPQFLRNTISAATMPHEEERVVRSFPQPG